ncbi:FMN-dependent NADH-azoreductase [uncultured Pseudomonas sp.]|uniref:FMN-dependent NADH-azoreductase n=1 Tax=uncultured Pseudomonas sp. TaxID=114707 RepID=UPI0025FF307C|nr:FMN-dependent NADH-azoreductase [uncultured Pseudomonas sp.]
MNILHIDSSLSGDASITRELSAAIQAELLRLYPAAQRSYRDLVQDDIPHLTGPIAAGFRPSSFSNFDAATLREHQRSAELVEEFLAADVLVIGAPMYNFSVPSQLKAWLDRIAQGGRTFRYTEQGPVGLCAGKQVIVASARGGFYAGTALERMDFQEDYLKAFFGFLGISDVRFVHAEGASRGAEVRSAQVSAALASIAAVVRPLPA